MRKQLLASTAAGILVGGILFNAAPAKADGYPVFDYAMNFAMGVFQKAFDKAMTGLSDAVTNIGNIFDKGITSLGTQNANYSKASISAQEQIADATNTVMARNARDIRNVQIRDEHVLSPQACASLDGGQAIAVSAGQSWKVGDSISAVTDRRNQGLPGATSWAGQGQAMQASNQLHLSRYCSQNEQTAGLCNDWNRVKENGDQKARSLLGSPSYTDQDAVNTANDYARGSCRVPGWWIGVVGRWGLWCDDGVSSHLLCREELLPSWLHLTWSTCRDCWTTPSASRLSASIAGQRVCAAPAVTAVQSPATVTTTRSRIGSAPGARRAPGALTISPARCWPVTTSHYGVGAVPLLHGPEPLEPADRSRTGPEHL